MHIVWYDLQVITQRETKPWVSAYSTTLQLQLFMHGLYQVHHLSGANLHVPLELTVQ